MKTAEEILSVVIKNNPSVIGYDVIHKAMQDYASQFIDAAAEIIINDEELVYNYDCEPINKDLSKSILQLKDQLK